MAETIISIITEWDNSFGMGHIQRMANLLVYLNAQDNIRAFIINQKTPPFIEESIKQYFVPEIPSETAIIIRDMRDSLPGDIAVLKKFGRVIVLDDCGQGRESADKSIDLLPNIKYKDSYRRENFIYGYSFTRSFLEINKKYINKKIDIAFYPGHSIIDECTKRIISFIPSSLTYVILASNNSYMIQDGKRYPVSKSYAEILLSSRILISHFGISLYEGSLCGCGLISINPTRYHSDLCDSTAADLKLQNLGTRENIKKEKLQQAVQKAIQNSGKLEIDTTFFQKKLRLGLDLLFQEIISFVI